MATLDKSFRIKNGAVVEGSSGVVVRPNGTSNDAIIITGGANTNTRAITLVPASLTANQTITFPDATGTIITTAALGTGVLTALGVNTGTAGSFVVNGGALGTPSSGNLSNATSLPVSTGISGLGTGVATALAVNVGSAGAFVTFNGALGTPTSATLSNATGLPISTGVSGLGTNVATFLGTPSSANLFSALTSKTGNSSNVVFADSPALSGTPTSTTAAIDTNSTQIATTAYVINQSYLKTTTASSTYAPIASPTFTGTVTLPGDPTSALHAATKQYVDNVVTQINYHQAAKVGTTGALGTAGNLVGGTITTTYNNGTGGVGATLTIATSSNWTDVTVDGQSLVSGDRILIKDQAAGLQNGIYTVTTVGTVGTTTSFVFTRATDADNSPSGELAGGDFVFILNGTVNAGYGYVCSNTSAITVGTTAVTYATFNASTTITAGTGLNESPAGTLNLNIPVILNHGGTNAQLTAVNGGIVWSNATQMQITAAGSAGQILRSGGAGAPSWSTATYPATTTANRILYSSATNTIGEITSANNQVLVTDGSGVPSFSATLPSGVTASSLTSFGTSPTLTSPTIDVINASTATATTPSLYANTTSGTINIGALVGSTAAIGTITIGGNAGIAGGTKTINLGTGATAGTTTITIGSAGGTSTTNILGTAQVGGNAILTAASTSSALTSFGNNPALAGIPTAPTAAANTNTTQIATTAFVLGQGNSTAGTITALGTQAAGTSNLYARADHVHPTTGIGLTSGTLAQFSATSSSQLAGVISDETGSGALVFGTSPTLTTPNIGTVATLKSSSVTATTSGVGATLDTFSTTSFTSAKYLIQARNPSTGEREVTELLVTVNNADVHIAEYGNVLTSGDLIAVTATFATNTVTVTVTPTANNIEVKAYATLIAI